MRVLVYKRTHKGDPDELGRFGIFECMGQVRTWEFDAVIGVGGIGSGAVQDGIDRKITWIGKARHKINDGCDGYPIWAFEQFYLKDEKGCLPIDKAPKLAKRPRKPSRRKISASF